MTGIEILTKASGPGLRWYWSETDRWHPLTVGAGVVLAAAPIFALVGIPRLPLMWPLYELGIVLPGCGLTRGVVALARGDLAGAWRWNPASFVVVAAVAATLVRTAAGIASGRWLHALGRPRRWMIVAAGLLVVALWVRQQSNADLLITH